MAVASRSKRELFQRACRRRLKKLYIKLERQSFLRGRSLPDYPPYVNAYGQLKELFKKIQEASTPARFSHDFLYTVLGLKSKSHRPMIPFLKRLGFLDPATVPTKAYTDYRDPDKSRIVMADQVRSAYQILFTAHSYAYKLKKEEIMSKLVSVLGVSKDDKVVPVVASTFLELVKLADFEAERVEKPAEPAEPIGGVPAPLGPKMPPPKLGLSYTINLNLPATTDPKVFEAIFKALKEYLLR
jgi:hypothetical protein